MNKFFGFTFAQLLVICIIASLTTDADAEVLTGRIEGWEESTTVFKFDDNVGVTTELEGWWSIALESVDGYFYGDNDTTVVSVAGVTNISDVTDASTYTYSPPPLSSVGPVTPGAIILFHNTATGYYGAFLFEEFTGPITINVTWYLQDNGTGDFSDYRPLSVPTGMLHLLLLQD